MDKTPENNVSDNAKNPAQNELDLGFNSLEPITPKKPIKPEISFFNKAKGVFARKEAQEIPQFNLRKEPTFGTPNIEKNVNLENPADSSLTPESVQPVVTTAGFTEAMKNVGLEVPEVKSHHLTEEPSLPNQLEPASLTGTSETAETLAQEGNADTQADKPADNSGTQTEEQSENQSDEQAPLHRSEDDLVAAAKAKIKKPEDWEVMQKLPPKHRRLLIALCAFLILLGTFFWLKPDTPTTVEDFQAQNGQTLPIEFRPIVPEQSQIAENIEDQAMLSANDSDPALFITTTHEQAKALAVVAQQFVQNTVKDEVATPNHEPETAKTAENTAQNVTQPADKNKSPTHKVKEMEQKASASQVTGKNSTNKADKQRNAPVTEAKPVRTTDANRLDNMAESIASGTAKTLTVPAGVSLMQVFRNHNLNIADVNAMTKAAGSGNVLSSFKPGDKVQVVVNAQGRVTVLRLSNGATFTRQSNGTYKYHK